MNPQEDESFSLKLSAPGKVILFGEYSVVFNKPAIAATLCLRTKLYFSETNSGYIKLNFSALKLEKSFALKDIKEYFKISSTDSWESRLLSLTKALEYIYEKTYDVFDLTEPQKFSLVVFFHCFCELLHFCKGFQLKIDSELPVGSGVGSSASFSVVLSAAALFYEHYINKNVNLADLTERNEKGITIIAEKFKNKISEIALSCEKIFHGNPSGVDHNTILQGSMLQFIKSDSGNKMSQLRTCPIRIMLVNTNVPRSTKKLLISVKELKENHSQVIEYVLNAMESIAIDAIKDLTLMKENLNEINKLEAHFGELVSLNHNLLRVLGVSHSTLEQIISIAKKYNLNAKITGGGGGGFAFIYLPNNVETLVVKTLEKELTNAGFTPYEVTLGVPGLTVEELVY